MSDTTREDCEFVRWFASLDGAEIDIVGGKSGAEEAARFVWTASRQKALQEAEKLRAALINIEEACVYSPHREIGTWDASLAQLIHHHVQFLQAASAIRSLGGITSNEGDKERG